MTVPFVSNMAQFRHVLFKAQPLGKYSNYRSQTEQNTIAKYNITIYDLF